MCSGVKSIQSCIRAIGLRVQRDRIRDIVSEIKDAHGIAGNRSIRRHAYSVLGPLSLWHIDGNHKLVRWVEINNLPLST